MRRRASATLLLLGLLIATGATPCRSASADLPVAPAAGAGGEADHHHGTGDQAPADGRSAPCDDGCDGGCPAVSVCTALLPEDGQVVSAAVTGEEPVVSATGVRLASISHRPALPPPR